MTRWSRRLTRLMTLFTVVAFPFPLRATESEILWRDPVEVGSRDLFYGPGDPHHFPQGPFVFVKEDLNGTSPKIEVRDSQGTKWKIKLGVEARPEVAASRLIWAVGYFAGEDYFLSRIQVKNLPPAIRRGRELISENGLIDNLRLRREARKKIDLWRWRDNPFVGTKEFNGLRVMMALLGNYDLKDENNAVYGDDSGGETPSALFYVKDLGASFSARIWPPELKGDLRQYARTPFVLGTNDDFVNFNLPTGPAAYDAVHLPGLLVRARLRWIGKNIPRSHVRWIAGLLSKLSADQIADAFRAAGYSPDEAQGFVEVVGKRIAELDGLSQNRK
jgi:hypothetical protein